MTYSKALLVWLALALFAPTTLHAADFLSDRFSLHGFGTFGLTYSDTADAEFIRDIAQQEGVSDGWSADVDSRLGLQLGFRATPELDAVVQVVSRYNYEGDYDPTLTWAFLRYNPDPAVQLRLGRVALDTYMLADSRDVGFGYLWVRPPVDYYGNRHLSYIDGGDITMRAPFGQGLVWAKLYAGVAGEKIASEAGIILDAAGSTVVGGHVNYATGPWHLQLAATNLDYELKAPAAYLRAVEMLELFNPLLAQALHEAVQPVEMQLYSAGVAYDDGPLLIQAMLGHLNRPHDYVDVDSAYVTLGYRLDRVTPYLTLSGTRTEGIVLRELGLPVEGEFGLTQHTVAIGARYDVARDLALKTQLDHIDVEQSGILWRGAAPGREGDATIFSISLDFVF